jgi:hypothetical protein
MSRYDEFSDQEPNLFERFKQSGQTGLVRRVGSVILLLVVIALGYSAYNAYQDSKSTKVTAGQLPLILADQTPWKTTPDDPGGMVIPNKDSTIFNTLKGKAPDEESVRIENLLEEPEVPIAKDELLKTTSTEEVKPEPEISALKSEVATKEEPAKEKSLKEEDVKASEEKTSDVKTEEKAAIEEKKVVEPKIETPSPEEPKTKEDKPDETGSAYVQVASVKSREEASQKWQSLKSKNVSLSSLSMRVQEADLGARGIFYRIQAGPMSSGRAKSICAGMNAKQAGSCLVVK